MLVEITTLSVSYLIKKEEIKAVEEVTLQLKKGEAIAIVGESGCGKSTLANTMIRLLPTNALIKKGTIKYNQVDILRLPEETFRTNIRWKEIAYVPQGSFNALNPVIKISDQIIEAITTHEDINKEEARERAEILLKSVDIEDEMVEAYPHELSGGMTQRTVIALALACNPKLLIADEPTTALDVIIQAQIITLLKSLLEKLNLSLILISHDISLVTSICNEIVVMYAGNIIEKQTSKEFSKHPLHPYSKLLIETIPRVSGRKKKLKTIPGNPPDLKNPPSGCKFHPRCPFARKKCQIIKPTLERNKGNSSVACHYPLQGGLEM